MKEQRFILAKCNGYPVAFNSVNVERVFDSREEQVDAGIVEPALGDKNGPYVIVITLSGKARYLSVDNVLGLTEAEPLMVELPDEVLNEENRNMLKGVIVEKDRVYFILEV